MKELVRVGVLNNFNFTDKEIESLKQFDIDCFVNSNSFVKVDSTFPSIITINPYLNSFVPINGDLSNVKACRIKLCINAKESVTRTYNEAIRYCVYNKIPILFTWQRFTSKQTLLTYCTNADGYNYNHSYYRPTEDSRDKLIQSLVNIYGNKELMYQCDAKGTGCPDCNNCIRLVKGDAQVKYYEVSGLNLSCSGNNGKCLFNCPDCFAKRLSAINNGYIKCDTIKQNNKQKGKTKHE